MQQRDIIKDQIDQLGKVLAKLVSDFLAHKEKGQPSLGIEVTNQTLKSELDIDVSKIKMLGKSELKNYLVEKQFAAMHFEILSEYFIEISKAAKEIHQEDSEMWLKKATELQDMAEEISKTVSFLRLI